MTNSYALFSDEVTGVKTIEATVKLSNLDKSGANEPVLDSSMIPVYYDSNNNVWKKADIKNHNDKYKWYDYDNKMWANSVTVSSTNRSTYQSASLGTTIPMDDILTMQVWIPRYKYKVWNYNANGTKTSSPQQIEITFEKENKNTSEISCQDAISGTEGKPSETCKLKSTNTTCTDTACNNKTYTHPAFTFGNEEIKGFWIGKFELTGTISNIATKPDVQSLRSQNVSTFETNIMNMKNNNNIYGLSTTTDTHMIKNIEWGAVAYLSHSKYGTCTNGTCKEVGINNNSNYITGCGAKKGTSATTACNSYNTETGKLASTTNNIYGIYDMSGNSNEYTMGILVSSDGNTLLSGFSTTYNSGYTGNIYGSNTKYSGIAYPANKYYDKYSYSTSNSSLIRSKLGDAIKEIFNSSSVWYSSSAKIPYVYYPWSNRGCKNEKSDSSIFCYDGGSGASDTRNSTRLIITSN